MSAARRRRASRKRTAAASLASLAGIGTVAGAIIVAAPGPAYPAIAQPGPAAMLLPAGEPHVSAVISITGRQVQQAAAQQLAAKAAALAHARHLAHLAHLTHLRGMQAVTTVAVTHGAGGSGLGAEVLARALSMSGVPYVFGGDTPGGFDCSGLVYWASQQLGITAMPRDTFEMLSQGVASGVLVPVASPSYGDLAFFGSGHVEFWVKPGETFGAQNTGTLVGYHQYGGGYQPTAFYRIA